MGRIAIRTRPLNTTTTQLPPHHNCNRCSRNTSCLHHTACRRFPLHISTVACRWLPLVTAPPGRLGVTSCAARCAAHALCSARLSTVNIPDLQQQTGFHNLHRFSNKLPCRLLLYYTNLLLTSSGLLSTVSRGLSVSGNRPSLVYLSAGVTGWPIVAVLPLIGLAI